MALAIDASTPVYAHTNTNVGVVTTASFTPPVGALLVAMYADGDASTALTSITNTGGGVGTWSKLKSQVQGSVCNTEIWIATVTSSVATTVSANVTSHVGLKGLGVVVVTGQAATQNGGTQGASSASGTPSGTIASLVGANSLILGTIANDTNQTGPTIPAGQSDSFNANTYLSTDAGLGSGVWAQYLTGMNLSAAVSATINDTAPTGIEYSLAMVEILAAASTVTVPPASPRSRARALPALRRGRFPVVPGIAELPVRRSFSRPAALVMARGRRWFPVQPQIPFPKPVFPVRTPAGRRALTPARGHRWWTIPEQTPVWQSARARASARVTGPSRGRRFTLTPQDPAMPIRVWSRGPRSLPPRRAGRSTLTHSHVQTINRMPQRRTWIAPRRGGRTVPVPGQAAPVAPKWPPTTLRSRPRPGMLRRGHRFDPAWPITIVPPPPSICYPTVASIVAYTAAAAVSAYSSTAAIRAYSGTATIRAYSSAAALTGYSSSAAIRSYTTSGAITGYASSAGLVRYTTSVTIRTCGL